MKRLLDTSDDVTSSEDAAHARHLLSSVDALPRSAARKRHVWNAVARRASGRPRFGALLLAPAVLLVGASSLAAYQGAWPSSWIETLGIDGSEVASSAATTPGSARSQLQTSSTVVAPPTNAQAIVNTEADAKQATPDDASRDPKPSVALSPSASPTKRSSLAKTHAASAATTTDESQLLVEALQARRSGDHARAEQLAEQYSRAAPRGALAE
mgnify:CR=1 FL=1